MIKMHISFIFTKRIAKITICIVAFVSMFFFVISNYRVGFSTIMIQEEEFMYDYLLQGFTTMKLLIVLYSAFMWIYATQMNNYDVYLYSRYNPITVLTGKFIAINLLTLLVSGFFGVAYVLVWSLYPNTLEIAVAFGFFVVLSLFGLYYNALFWIASRITKHLYGLFIPLIGYMISMISVDINTSPVKQETIAIYTQIFFPDIIYFDNRFMFMYGALFVFSMGLILVGIVIHIFRKNDLF